MKRRKMVLGRMAAVLLFLCFVLAPINSFAAQTDRFLENCEVAEGMMKVYCTDFSEEKQILPEQFTAALGSQETAVTGVSTVQQEGTPVTVYCLVDVSGSMDESQMAQAKEILTSVLNGLKDNDNMVIGSLGNDLSASDFLTDKSEIQGMIDSLAPGNEDTNLYKGIVGGIQTLKESGRANRKKCLLILSDGEDDQKSGITQSEAEAAVKSSSIPVYTAATLKSSQTDEEIAFAKLLGSFARISVGGKDYAPAIDGVQASAVGEDILANIRSGIVLTLDTSQVDRSNKDTLLLRVVYTSEDQSVKEDTMEIFAEDLVYAEAGAEEPTEEPIEEATEEPTEVPEPIEPENGFPWILAAGIAAAVLAVLVIIIIVLRKKKQGAENESEAASEEPQDSSIESIPETSAEPQKERRRNQAAKGPVCEVRFTAIGYENICFVLQMEEGRILTLGRDKRADLILNPEDRKLSGVHCKVQCQGNTLRIWDMDSTNGTFVNGVPLKKIKTAVIEEGQSVRMGSYEYRIAVRNKGV